MSVWVAMILPDATIDVDVGSVTLFIVLLTNVASALETIKLETSICVICKGSSGNQADALEYWGVLCAGLASDAGETVCSCLVNQACITSDKRTPTAFIYSPRSSWGSYSKVTPGLATCPPLSRRSNHLPSLSQLRIQQNT